MQDSWFSNGNLIISGEYFVLAGAKALAVPLRFGQLMKVETAGNNQSVIHWNTSELGKTWFRAEFTCKDLNLTSSTDTEIAFRLQKILKAIRNLKPHFFDENKSYKIDCEIEFNLNWGWGSSSTLISNLASYAGIDPFELNRIVSPGSGYDIAAALSQTPVFYRLTDENHEIDSAPFMPGFKNFIWFLYQGRKQSTSTGIENSIKYIERNKGLIPLITDLTERIATEENMNEFIRCIAEHEKIISAVLNKERIKKQYFSDFEGEIKSLGAWGGDCAMVVSHLDEKTIRQYFGQRGLNTIFGFDEIVKLN
jgi:mevalonate kinase